MYGLAVADPSMDHYTAFFLAVPRPTTVAVDTSGQLRLLTTLSTEGLTLVLTFRNEELGGTNCSPMPINERPLNGDIAAMDPCQVCPLNPVEISSLRETPHAFAWVSITGTLGPVFISYDLRLLEIWLAKGLWLCRCFTCKLDEDTAMKAAENLSVAFDKGVEESKSLLEQGRERSDYYYHFYDVPAPNGDACELSSQQREYCAVLVDDDIKVLYDSIWLQDTVESISVEVDILVVDYSFNSLLKQRLILLFIFTSPQLPDVINDEDTHQPEVVLCGSEARTHYLCNRPSSVGNISKRRSGIISL
ncbi:hypothetical protein BJ165DRAFT_1597981 [Panaeolus papilionaceus]|nr:hypothetical protein BJ165DRAFT_1597981 [Panaeolus papilionaceus]